MHEESNARSVVCPVCESGNLHPSGRLSMRCGDCNGVLAGPLLRTLLDVASLPELGTPSASNGHAPLSGDGRSGWLDFYMNQYRMPLGDRREDGEEPNPGA